MLSRSYGPSNILRLSFRERKNKAKIQEGDKLQNRLHPVVQPPPPTSHDHTIQPPVTREAAAEPPVTRPIGDDRY